MFGYLHKICPEQNIPDCLYPAYKFRVIMKFAVTLYVCVVQFIVSYQLSSDYKFSHYNRYLEAWLIKSKTKGSI
jgi:hypothetical protein